MRRVALAAALLGLVAMAPAPPVAITIEHGTVVPAPATIRLRVTVEPDADNRELWVGLDSDGFSTSSYEELDGASAPKTRWIEIKAVPRGEYLVLAQIERVSHRQFHAQAPLIVW